MKTVHQLNKYEIEELNPFNEYTKEELFAKYSNTLFTKGDFFCNIKEFKTLETIKQIRYDKRKKI